MKLSCCHRHILMQNRGRILRYSLLLLLLGFVGYTRNNHAAGEFYATRIYPHLSVASGPFLQFLTRRVGGLCFCLAPAALSDRTPQKELEKTTGPVCGNSALDCSLVLLGLGHQLFQIFFLRTHGSATGCL